MIKQIWTIRSPQRLFSGLAAAITGVFVLYTAISLFYLPETVPFRLLGALSRQKALSRDCRTASMMFWSVGLGFLQLDALNMAKQMQGFGLFVPLVCLIAMVIVSIRYRLKLRGLAHAGGRRH